MKKLFKIISALFAVCVLCAAVALAGCGKSMVKFLTAEDGKAENAIFTVENGLIELGEDTSVAEYLAALKDKGELDYTAEDSSYGLFITSVKGIENVTDESGTHGWSWTIFTNLTELDGVVYSSAEYGTYQADGVTLYSANYGVSALPCIEGYVYALVYSEWSWG